MKMMLTRAVVLAAALAASPVQGEDEPLPQYPDEQQELLRSTEDKVIETQRALFAARQKGDEAAVKDLTEQMKKLQSKRRALIDATKDRLPSE